jgi:hypothetical protein
MADLSKIKVRDCELSVRTCNTLTHRFGHDVTLADIAGALDAAILTPPLTRKGLKEIQEAIANAEAWVVPLPRPDAAIEQLTNHQQQLDQDGVMVGVSRQALEEVLEWLKD